MLEFLLAVAISLTSHSQIPQNVLNKELDRGEIIPVDYQETTSFSNAITLTLNDANNIALFHSVSDSVYSGGPNNSTLYFRSICFYNLVFQALLLLNEGSGLL